MSDKWSPNSWRNKNALHMPNYQNEDHLNKTLNEISKYPPLVFAGEARLLKRNLEKFQTEMLFYYKVEIVQKVLQIFIQIILEIHLKLFYKWLLY